MQTVDLILANARVFNVSNFDVTTDQKLTLQTNMGPDIRWFSDNDEVLDIKAAGDSAEVKVGITEGECTILIMNKDKVIQKELFIRTYHTLPMPAVTLNATADTPVLK